MIRSIRFRARSRGKYPPRALALSSEALVWATPAWFGVTSSPSSRRCRWSRTTTTASAGSSTVISCSRCAAPACLHPPAHNPCRHPSPSRAVAERLGRAQRDRGRRHGQARRAPRPQLAERLLRQQRAHQGPAGGAEPRRQRALWLRHARLDGRLRLGKDAAAQGLLRRLGIWLRGRRRERRAGAAASARPSAAAERWHAAAGLFRRRGGGALAEPAAAAAAGDGALTTRGGDAHLRE